MEDSQLQTSTTIPTNAADSTEVKETEPGLLELSKPSEFRLKSLKQKKYVKKMYYNEQL